MRYPINRASRIALGVFVAASCAAACTLMSPSHEELSGGENETPAADAAVDLVQDTSLQPDAPDDSEQPDAEAATTDVVDAHDDTKDGEPHDADAATDGPSDAKDEPDAPLLSCDGGDKVCQNACVAINDPGYGCGQTTCQPCALFSADAGCQNGKCSVGACNLGHSDCDDASANGCESDPQNDPKNCGACGNACTAPPHMTTQCVAGECTAPVCSSGWADCDPDGGIDGCETPTDFDPDNCGACGNVCPDGPNGTRQCNAGKCELNCFPPHEDCDGDLLNGCETTSDTDPSNCGICGHKCAFAHATAKCFFGNCELDTCSTLWGDCNFIESDGCEKDLSSDKNNCGACFNKCGGLTCTQGVCN